LTILLIPFNIQIVTELSMSLYQIFLEEELDAYYPPEGEEDENENHPSLTAEERGGCKDYSREPRSRNIFDRF
jgi:hypothetical protein